MNIVSRRPLFHKEHGSVTLIDSRSFIAAISRFRFFVPGVNTVQQPCERRLQLHSEGKRSLPAILGRENPEFRRAAARC